MLVELASIRMLLHLHLVWQIMWHEPSVWGLATFILTDINNKVHTNIEINSIKMVNKYRDGGKVLWMGISARCSQQVSQQQEVSKLAHVAGGTTSNGQSAGGAARPLADCWVTLAALEGDSDERAHVHDMVRQAGGRIFDAKRVNLVADAARAYAVCPLSFPPERLAEAARQPDFRLGACAVALPGVIRLHVSRTVAV